MTLMFLWWSKSSSTSKVSVLTCSLASFHFTNVIHREENTLSGLIGTRDCLRKLKCTIIVAILRRSYSICLDMKCSNSSKSNHRRLVSVPVPRIRRIRDVSLLCYRFQSERIAETAKRNNVVNYLDIVLSCPGLLKPNQDILAPRRQRSGFRDRVSQTGTVPEKPGRTLVSRLTFTPTLLPYLCDRPG